MLKGPNRTPNRMLFNPTEIPENVRTIPNNFKSQRSESDDINPCIYYTMSRRARILFRSVQPRIECYSTRLTFRTMSEPFQIFFKSEKVGIRYIHSLYMLNNVWITLNIISIGTTQNRMLFNPTDIPNNVRTMPNIF